MRRFVEADKAVDSNFGFEGDFSTLPFGSGPGAGSKLGASDM